MNEEKIKQQIEVLNEKYNHLIALIKNLSDRINNDFVPKEHFINLIYATCLLGAGVVALFLKALF